MSLLDDSFEECLMYDKRTVSDGYGGFDTAWVEGASFTASIVANAPSQIIVGEKVELKDTYTVVTRKNLNLQFHDVFKRVSDGKIFRVTSDGDDKKTPDSAGLDMRQVSAEEFTLS